MLEPYHDFDPTTDEGALVAAIRADPHADTPKLVMADWQDDHGSPVVAAMYRGAVKGGDTPKYVGPLTAADGAAVSRHAGMLSGLVKRRPANPHVRGSLPYAVNVAATYAQHAATDGPMTGAGLVRVNRHAMAADFHTDALMHHAMSRTLTNRQANLAHRFAYSIHRRLGGQE